MRRKLKGRARVTHNDRWFFVQLYRWFPSILPVLMIMRPETRTLASGWLSPRLALEIASTGRRPPIEAELRALIRQMSTENSFWGAPRIHGELLKLGFEVAQTSVANGMDRPCSRP